MRRPCAFHPAARAAIKSALSSRWQAIALGAIRHRNSISPFNLAVATFAWVAATLAIMTYQEKKQENAAIEVVGNEMIVSRQPEQTYSQTEEVEASDDEEGDEEAVPSNYPRMVQTVRFVNPGAPQNIDTTGERTAKGRLNVRTHVPTDNPTYRAEGNASWYGPDFHGRRTANGSGIAQDAPGIARSLADRARERPWPGSPASFDAAERASSAVRPVGRMKIR